MEREPMGQDTSGQKPDDKVAAQVMDLSGMIGYQAGSVVSRTLLDRKAGTVTLFAFESGQGLSEHTAPFDALVYVLDGRAGITVGGQPFQLKAGDAIIMPANQPHALQAIDKFKMMLVMIKG